MAQKGMLINAGKCIACRSCQVACKQWNDLPAVKTTFFAAPGGYQNPAGLSKDTYTLVKFYESKQNGEMKWNFRVHRCFHCEDPVCVEACPTEPKAMTHDKELGAVYVNKELCIGCGACNEYCPWHIPQVDEDAEKSTKCLFCVDRTSQGLMPACAKACPTGCIVYDDYDKILELAHQAKADLEAKGEHPYIYGEKELGTGMRVIMVLPEPIDMYPDLPKNPTKSEDLGLFRDILRPLGKLTVTASLVGLVIARVKEVREKQEVSSSV